MPASARAAACWMKMPPISSRLLPKPWSRTTAAPVAPASGTDQGADDAVGQCDDGLGGERQAGRSDEAGDEDGGGKRGADGHGNLLGLMALV